MEQHRKQFIALFLVSFSAVFIFWLSNSKAEQAAQTVTVPPPLVNIPEPYHQQPQKLDTAVVTILTASGQKHTFTVELAKTPEEKRIGMMFRTSVPENTGMLFLFEDEVQRSFWMKNTHVSLDLVFIRRDGVIVHIHERAEPFSLRPLPSERPAYAVLEIAGGVAAKLGLTVGDRVVYEGFSD